MKTLNTLILWLMILGAFPQDTLAALTAGTMWQIQPSATASNVNGSGFDPANTNFATDGAILLGTSSAPTITSSSYSFVSGDIGAYVFFPTQSNIYAGWYKITSVTAGKVTLSAAALSSVTYPIGAQGIVTLNANQGVATGAAETSVTYGVDYTQQNAAAVTHTQGTQTANSNTFTDSTNSPFTYAMVGNVVHITACTGTSCNVGWYEIISYTDSADVVLDRTIDSSNNVTASTYYVGGAGVYGALDNTYQAALPASSIVWILYGSYTLGATTSTTNTNCTAILNCFFIGFNTIRGDNPTGANRPTLNTSTFDWEDIWGLKNMIVTGSAAIMMTPNGLAWGMDNVKVTNTSTTTTRVAIDLLNGTTNNQVIRNVEAVSQNGTAINCSNSACNFNGVYVHDSNIGIAASYPLTLTGSILEANTTDDINLTGSVIMNNTIINNTIAGTAAQEGVGINIATNNGNNNTIMNNIITGFVTGIDVANGSAARNMSGYNDFYNNGTDVTNWTKETTDLALNPTFTSFSQLTNQGTVTSTTTTLTDTGASFGVNNNVDYLHITAITGSGCNTGVYLITGHTSTTLTLNNSAGATCTAITYFVTHGHNFTIGTNLQQAGFPVLTNATGSQTTSYPAIGAVTPQPISGGAGEAGYAFP